MNSIKECAKWTAIIVQINQIRNSEQFSPCLDRTPEQKPFLTKGYFKKVLEKFQMQKSRPVPTTMDSGSYNSLASKQTRTNEGLEMKSILYREATGDILYLSTGTTPNIAVSVNVLCRYVNKTRPIHWNEVRRVLMYLCGTTTLRLLISPNTNILSATV